MRSSYETFEENQIKREEMATNMALRFAAKNYKRVRKAIQSAKASRPNLSQAEIECIKENASLNAYVLNAQFDPQTRETRKLHLIIEDLAKNGVSDVFQIAYVDGMGHWCFGEISIDCENKKITILLYDPIQEKNSRFMSPLRNLDLFLSENEFGFGLAALKNALPHFKFQFYLPSTKLQNTERGCYYHTIYGCYKLSNQKSYQDIYKFMLDNQEMFVAKEKKELVAIETEYKLDKDAIIMAPAPPRMACVGFNLEKLNNYFSVYLTVDNFLTSSIVNSRGLTAQSRSEEHVSELKEGNQSRIGNLSLNAKLPKWRKDVADYCDGEVIFGKQKTKDGLEKEEAIAKHSLQGLQEHAKKRISKIKSKQERSNSYTDIIFPNLAVKKIASVSSDPSHLVSHDNKSSIQYSVQSKRRTNWKKPAAIIGKQNPANHCANQAGKSLQIR